jgi:hypothetical protein
MLATSPFIARVPMRVSSYPHSIHGRSPPSTLMVMSNVGSSASRYANGDVSSLAGSKHLWVFCGKPSCNTSWLWTSHTSSLRYLPTQNL